MSFLSRTVVFAAAFALPLAFTVSAHADSSCYALASNLVANCGFETGDFTGWNLNDPSNNSYVDGHNPASGNYAATLGAEPGTLSQTITDVAGQLYDFSFDLQNETAVDQNGVPYPGPDSLGVSVIDTNGDTTTLFPDQSIPQSNTYSLYSFTFVGSGTDTIMFSINNVPSYYDLDNVVVNAPTPEPSSLALMGTGALVFAELTRRRVRKAQQAE
jgi:hypothetical protein